MRASAKLFSNKMQIWELLNKIKTCMSYQIPSYWKFVTGSWYPIKKRTGVKQKKKECRRNYT